MGQKQTKPTKIEIAHDNRMFIRMNIACVKQLENQAEDIANILDEKQNTLLKLKLFQLSCCVDSASAFNRISKQIYDMIDEVYKKKDRGY